MLVAGALLVAACASEGEQGPILRPDRATFPLVNDALGRRCATLDCHGSRERNLRLYGASGLRLDPESVPGVDETTEAEYSASYASVVGLEPEVMSEVVGDEGRDPDRLTLVRKALGREFHRPGIILYPNDPAYLCMVSWLASAIDEAACQEAADFEAPEPTGEMP